MPEDVIPTELREMGATANCQCLKRIKAALADKHGGEVDLGLKLMIDTKTYQSGIGLPPLQYTYLEGKKRKKGHIPYFFCPFCGQKGN